MTLKTLNELEEGKYMYKGLVQLRHVRDEAIKWVKHYLSRIDDTNEWTLSDFQQRAAANAIMNFHNITEEDLK